MIGDIHRQMSLVNKVKRDSNVSDSVTVLGISNNGNLVQIPVTDVKEYIDTGVSISYSFPSTLGEDGDSLVVSEGALSWSDVSITLTTSGTSGSATLTDGVLNIPTYAVLDDIVTESGITEPYLDDTVIALPEYVLGASGNEGSVQIKGADGLFTASEDFTYVDGNLTMPWFEINSASYYALFNKGKNWVLDGGFISVSHSLVSNQNQDSYTLNINDIDIMKVFTNTNKVVVTVPSNDDVEFKVGTEIDLVRTSTDNVLQVFATNGVTVNKNTGLYSEDIDAYEVAKLKKISTNGWLLNIIPIR